MKNSVKKITAVSLCALLIAGTVGVTAFAENKADSKGESGSAAKIEAAETSADSTSSKKEAKAESGVNKDETVYVLVDAEGNTKKIIVSDWLKNADKSNEISDYSELENIENVKGNEEYTMGGDNTRVWSADGNDIYYQGNIDKELPVSVSVSYKLDGKAIAPSELSGKSGKVSIRYTYKNNQYEMKDINGKQEKIYVPFAMLTGIMLDNDVFTNIEVSNGKMINDGDRTTVIGIAFPGLQSDLGLSGDKIEIPEYVEITADVKKFELTNTVTVATNEIFSKMDSEKIDSANDLESSLGTLTDAIAQLVDGSSQLYDGLCTLLDKSGELISGIDKLAAGAKELKSGAGELSSGASELSGGLSTLAANNAQLNGGAKQVFESLLSMADEQLSAAGLEVPKLTIENYSAVLDGIIASLDKDSVYKKAYDTALAAVTEEVNKNRDTIYAKVYEQVWPVVYAQVKEQAYDQVLEQVLAQLGMTKEQYEAGVAAGVITEEQQAQVNAAVEASLTKIAEPKAKEVAEQKTEEQVQLLIEQNMNSPEVQAKINAALETAASGAASIVSLKMQLDSYNTFYTGLRSYTAGVAEASNGAGKLSGGASELYSGVCELTDGIFTLQKSAPALVDGVKQLKDGAMRLSDGLNEFNEKGIEKILGAAGDDLDGLALRYKAIIEVSENYKTFAGISDGMDGRVKFIYRTDAIE